MDLAFHWAPVSRRGGIRRYGLRPGSFARSRAWRPPFVCLSRDPAYALASSAAQTELVEPMDLWQLDLADDQCPPRREEFDWHDEVRIYERVPARLLTLLATRDAELGAP